MDMRLESKRLCLRRLALEDVEPLLDLRVRNRHFTKPFEPRRVDAYFTLDGQKEVIKNWLWNWEETAGFMFGIFLRADDPRIDETLVGHVNLSNVVRGAWENCTIGYFLDKAHNGKGLATEAVGLAVQFAFTTAGLHRIQGAVMPRNAASVRVLEKNGFRREGFSPRYLRIGGRWEDHFLYAVTSEEWGERT